MKFPARNDAYLRACSHLAWISCAVLLFTSGAIPAHAKDPSQEEVTRDFEKSFPAAN